MAMTARIKLMMTKAPNSTTIILNIQV